MNVGAQPHIVGEVPSYVIGVFVDHDVIAVPIPAVAIGKVKRGDTEVEAAKPETAGITTLDAPPVCAAETAFKAAVLPGVVDAESVVIPSRVVTNPFAAVVDVRSLGMVFPVSIGAPVPVVVVVVFAPVAMISRGPMARNVSSTDIVMAVVSIMVVVSLRKGGQREDQGGRKDAGD